MFLQKALMVEGFELGSSGWQSRVKIKRNFYTKSHNFWSFLPLFMTGRSKLSQKVISHFTICVKPEICEWQFSFFFVILRERLVNVCMTSHEIAKIAGIGREQDFSTWNWSENVIPWKAKNLLLAWIFREHEMNLLTPHLID